MSVGWRAAPYAGARAISGACTSAGTTNWQYGIRERVLLPVYNWGLAVPESPLVPKLVSAASDERSARFPDAAGLMPSKQEDNCTDTGRNIVTVLAQQ